MVTQDHWELNLTNVGNDVEERIGERIKLEKVTEMKVRMVRVTVERHQKLLMYRELRTK